MSYLEAGSGRPILFLSGSLGGAFMWRHVLRAVSRFGRCVAPDLLGTGRSERLTPAHVSDYGLDDHRGLVDGFLEMTAIEEPLVLVVHGWASIVGFDLATRRPQTVAGICHMESILRPLVWPDLMKPARDFLKAIRSSEVAHLLHDEAAIREHLRAQTLARMPEQDRDQYFEFIGPNPAARAGPIAGWNLIPVSGRPAKTRSAVEAYRTWLQGSSVPKLLIEGRPGYLTTGSHLDTASDHPNQEHARVAGSHLLPEDSPDGISLYLARFVESLARPVF